MPARITNFIPHSCFGYYDEEFEECTKKCKVSRACKNATLSDECDEVRKIYKFKKSQIDELVKKWKTKSVSEKKP